MSRTLLSLRRYPVKSMGGESLETVEIDARGLHGDRRFAVADAEGHLASGKNTRRFRRRDGIFDYAATTLRDGVGVSHAEGGWALGDPALAAHLSGRLGLPVDVVEERDVPHQDGGQVSLVGSASLRWCAERFGLDADPRRLRVTLVVQTEIPFEEEGWIGAELVCGTARLRAVERVERCRTIDVSQDGVSADGRWLKGLGSERELCLAVYADVLVPGRVSLGDAIGPV